MFLSTTVPSTMFNVNSKVSGSSPYRFSLPYDFSKGKNIIININAMPICNQMQDFTYYQQYLENQDSVLTLNRSLIAIPSNVQIFQHTMKFYNRYQQGILFADMTYTFEMTLDTITNSIMFTPTYFKIERDPSGKAFDMVDKKVTAAVLVTIQTIS